MDWLVHPPSPSSLPCTHTHTHTHTYTHTLSLSHSPTLTHAHTLTHSTHTFSITYSLSHTDTHSLYHILSITHRHTLYLTHGGCPLVILIVRCVSDQERYSYIRVMVKLTCNKTATPWCQWYKYCGVGFYRKDPATRICLPCVQKYVVLCRAVCV